MKKSFLLLNLFCMTQGVIAKSFFFDTHEENTLDLSNFPLNPFRYFSFQEDDDIESGNDITEETNKYAKAMVIIFNQMREEFKHLVSQQTPDDTTLKVFYEKQEKLILESIDQPLFICACCAIFINDMHLQIGEIKKITTNNVYAQRLYNALVCFYESLFNKAAEKCNFEMRIYLPIAKQNENADEDLCAVVSYHGIQRMLQQIKEALA